jgi:molybdenum cofactor cytidylyltransferase
MKFGAVTTPEAAGKVLAHHLSSPEGHKLFGKGHTLSATDVQVLTAAGIERVIVAALEAGDLSENEGARRVGLALAGPGVRAQTPGVGRANLLAEHAGPLRINVAALNHVNNIDEGITVATLREHTLVRPGQLVALVKIVPFAIAEARVNDVEAAARETTPIIAVRPVPRRSVALIVSGPEHARDKLRGDFEAPTRERLEKLGSSLDTVTYTAHDAEAICGALGEARTRGHDVVLMTGISAIIDRDDIAPTALRMAGGNVAHFGAPVDPGSLLMLGYLGGAPVLGMPGCAKSRKTNIIDWLLPRLLAGERLTRADIVVMGHGGLLEDISDRPMPRQIQEPGDD